jgi:hypothetical protein
MYQSRGNIHNLRKAANSRMKKNLVFLIILSLLFISPILRAQETTAPEKGEAIKSMGFPQTWKPYIGGLFDWDAKEGSRFGGELHLGLFRDIMSPIAGILGITGEGYVRNLGGTMDGGFRLLGVCKVLFFQAGIDYSFQRDNIDFLMSIFFPGKRSGPLGHGSEIRIDFKPNGGPTFSIGVNVPIFQKHIGQTRPMTDQVRLPEAPKPSEVVYKPVPELEEALGNIRESADWINRFTTPFFDQARKTDEKHLELFREKMQQFKDHIQSKDDQFPDGHSYDEEINFYHQELERAFSIALSNGNHADQTAHGMHFATKARKLLLDEVILPYNRLLGQWKENDTLLGFGNNAYQLFKRWVEKEESVPLKNKAAVLHIFKSLIQFMEENRQGSRKYWKDPRVVWIPMHYALRLEDHDTQYELDAIIERALEQEFTTGNDVHYVINEQFQWELSRMILEAKDYHVLWIHDYKGVNGIGEPDEIAYLMTKNAYLRALINAVKKYDERRKIPTYMIILDQHYFDINKGHIWLRVLEDPLEHKLKLPKKFQGWTDEMRKTQDELRTAVANSKALQAGLKHHGKKWLKDLVKVHINITNPSDFSFRSSHIFRYVPSIPDNVMRDHRKLTFYDVTELDPSKGEALYTGVGVGEHYTGPTWDDRAILVRGPALAHLKDEARGLLLSQGFTEEDIPPPLRRIPKPSRYDDQVKHLIEQGWTAKAMESHNFTGFGDKPNNLIKALIYNLMPKGSHMYVPDSLWNSPLWAGMLVSAALRGCWVFVVSPSFENAPSSGVPQMSRANEIFTRFTVIQNEMKEEIEATGGMFKTGVYNLDMDVADLIARIETMQDHFKSKEWLRRVFPFSESTARMILDLKKIAEEQGYKPVYLAEDVVERKPKLHLKTQFFASGKAVATLIPLEGWDRLVREYAFAMAEQRLSKTYVDAKKLRETLSEHSRPFLQSWWDSLSTEEREHIVFYWTLGSHNQDYRSKIQDGEVLVLVSGVHAMISYLDFFSLMSLTTWVESVEEVEKLLPRYGGFWYKIARYMKNAL